MEDERAVEELQHMQKTTESICAWLEATQRACPSPPLCGILYPYHPQAPAYLQRRAEPAGRERGGIRRDIAGILHTLNQAYDNLYDKLLSDVALDVSSEIAALQGMLANDGLAGEGLR